MIGEDIDMPERRTDRKPCPECGTGPTTCRALEWLNDGKRRCCPSCPADGHDVVEDGGPGAA